MKQRSGRNRPRQTVTTRSGNTLKVNRSLTDRIRASRAERAAAKAEYLSTLPKNRWKRLAARLEPKHLAQFWLSREGGLMALKIIGIAIVVCFFLTVGLFAYFRKDLPSIKDIGGTDLGGSISYYDRTGQILLWQDYNAVKRITVTSNNISPYMKDATVAIEDKNFYKEGAFDVRGIIRAAYHDAFSSGNGLQGGSTITQQLVKLNEGWTDNRTITRKIKEIILAVELEREYSKNDILTGYLNIAPYGGVDYGVETAAEDYFQTTAKNLTLAQAAMLAAIPQAPGAYSPYSSPQYNPQVTENFFDANGLVNRQHYILDQMAQQGYITQDQATAAKDVNILAEIHPQQSKYQNIKAPYYVLAAKQQLENQYGASVVNRGGWKVITALDYPLQQKTEQVVANNVPNEERRTAGLADEAASVVENVPTGQIVALVGGTNFNNSTDGSINYASSVLVAPGSSFKPYDYATLINNNNNVGAGSVFYDTEGPLPGYPCTIHAPAPPTGNGNCLVDYDNLQPGPLTLRYALGGSRDIPAVKAMLEAVPNDKSASSGYTNSINKVISTASAMMDNPYLQSQHQKTYNCYRTGTDMFQATPSDETQCYGASAIGDGAFLHLDDQVNGDSTFGRLGEAIPRTYILKITDASNRTIYQWKQPKGTQVIKKDSAYILDNMLSDPRASYLPGSCSTTTCSTLSEGGYKFQHDNGWDVAIKTGTTNNNFDGLMTAWTSQYAVVSWVGNHTRNVDISSITGTAMEYLTEPLTRGVLEAALGGIKPVNWTQPSDIKTLPSYVVNKHIDFGDEEPSPTDDIYPSWYIGGSSGKASSQTIDRVSGLLATSCTPPLAKETTYNGSTASWNIDIFAGGHQSIGSIGGVSNSSSPQATDNIHSCSDSPPTITLTAPGTCTGSCTITATVTQGTHPLSDPNYPQFPGQVTFSLDGQTIHSEYVSDSPSTVSFTYTPSSSGSGDLVARVTDSVLYQGTASQAINFSPPPTPGPGQGGQITDFTAIHTGNMVSFSWNGGVGPYNVIDTSNNITVCSNVSQSPCSNTTALAPPGSSVEIVDSDNDKANTTVQ